MKLLTLFFWRPKLLNSSGYFFKFHHSVGLFPPVFNSWFVRPAELRILRHEVFARVLRIALSKTLLCLEVLFTTHTSAGGWKIFPIMDNRYTCDPQKAPSLQQTASFELWMIKIGPWYVSSVGDLTEHTHTTITNQNKNRNQNNI